MHGTLAEHADVATATSTRPAVQRCAHDRDDRYLIEALTFANAGATTAMLRELCPNIVDGPLSVGVRNLTYRLTLLQRPGDPGVLSEAARSLRLHGPDWARINPHLRPTRRKPGRS